MLPWPETLEGYEPYYAQLFDSRVVTDWQKHRYLKEEHRAAFGRYLKLKAIMTQPRQQRQAAPQGSEKRHRGMRDGADDSGSRGTKRVKSSLIVDRAVEDRRFTSGYIEPLREELAMIF